MEISVPRADKMVQKHSDRSRKVRRVGKDVFVPHKFDPTGDPLSEETFNPKRDLSRLSLEDFALLDAMVDSGWRMEKACAKIGMEMEEAVRRYKRISYFEFEEKRSKALAATASPDFIAAKHLDNVFTNVLDDGQRDSLKELAKITGAYKQIAVNQTNIFNMPVLTPEQEAQLRSIGDEIAMKKSAIPTEASGA